ncbi:MAG: hypothetical protein K5839_06370, partial [Treponemataceae bacterium]|nr:hypothetical protein [Treponemataceae bacterium]
FENGIKNIETCRKEFDELCLKLENDEKALNEWHEKVQNTEKILSVNQNNKEVAEENVGKAKAQKEKFDKILDEKIGLSEFASLSQIEESRLENSQLQRIRDEISSYDKEVAALEKAVKDSEKSGNPEEIRNQLEAVREELDEKSKERDEFRNKIDEVKKELNIFRDSFEKVRDFEEKRLELENQKRPWALLSEHLNGNNSKKISFDTWALGLYFNEVVEYASRRFYDISNGRYEFRLKTESEKGRGNRGLDLEVLDNNTGDLRDPSSLSGGETFEASISLALAITDVVQNNNGGGIQLDSLFIDEGFGTLDEETLDKAMAVLNELQETKMVGIISHVAGLKNEIHSYISVEKSDKGSKILVTG